MTLQADLRTEKRLDSDTPRTRSRSHLLTSHVEKARFSTGNRFFDEGAEA